MNRLVLAAIIFAVAVAVIETSLYAYRTLKHPDRKKIRKRLKTYSSAEHADVSPDILKKKKLSEVPLLNRILLSFPLVQRLEMSRKQANVQYPIGVFILFTLLMAVAGFYVFFSFTRNLFTAAIMGLLLGALPIFYLQLKKKQRMAKFERQLPEALDLIARALKAGHAFTSGMALAAEEFNDPLGPEFDQTLDEINFGVSVDDALKALTRRIDCSDLKFFVVSVILQRETGGNLAELIESIAHLIRERFKFHGKIRTLSAEGKWSAYVLVGLPFVIVFVFRLINPEYMNTLFSEPAGRKMIGIALIIMSLGVMIMRRMIKIRV